MSSKLYCILVEKIERHPSPVEEATKPKVKPAKTSEAQRPIGIKKILENRIQPAKSEYIELKELDTRLHTLRFSNAIGKNNKEFQLDDGTNVKFNRYLYIHLRGYIAQFVLTDNAISEHR